MLMDHPFCNAQGAVEPYVFIEHIGQCQKSLGGVHVAVRPAIRLAVTPIAGKGLQQCPLVFRPKRIFKDLDRIAQQFGRPLPTGHDRRTESQRNKGMQVGLFAGSTRVCGRGGEPAAVFGITQRPGQRG